MRKSVFISGILFFFLACRDNSKNARIDLGDSRDTANLLVEWDTSSYVLRSSQAWLSDSVIDLSFYDTNNYASEMFFLEIKNQSEGWRILESISQPAVGDCLYVSSQFRILNQNIELNKTHFKKGDRIQGRLRLTMIGRKAMFREPEVPFIDNRKWDSISIRGFFGARID